MPSELLILAILVFAAAALYSSVGHGGASAYLAILVLAGFPREGIASTVLALNILATLLGTVNYWRAGHFDPRLLFPFILTSVPAAFLGGSLHISQQIFFFILGLTLLVAGLRFLLFTNLIAGR